MDGNTTMSRNGTSGSWIVWSDIRSLYPFQQRRIPIAASATPSLPCLAVEGDRLTPVVYNLARDHTLADGVLRGDHVHDLQHQLFDDDLQPARSHVALQRLFGDGLERVIGELQSDVLKAHDRLVLTNERVLRLFEDFDQRALVQLVQCGYHREPAHEFGDQPELDEIFRMDL